MESKLKEVAKHFALKGEIKDIQVLGAGFINDTYVVSMINGENDYILQRKNNNVFKNVPAMMSNINAVTTHLKKKIKENGGNPERETLTVIPTNSGELFYKDDNGEYWATTLRINNTFAYEYADTPELAYMGGKGIGKFQKMLSDFNQPLVDILPGFHDMRFRFQQWEEVLANDPKNRKKDLTEEIQWIESRKEEMMGLKILIENGEIPIRTTHNDTKIANMLFDKDGNVECVIDLDTVLSSSCLFDFGDAIRSYTNTGKEDDKDLNRVGMDMEMFKNYTKGYLSEAKDFLTAKELEYLAFSAKYITFEQVLRFLMDYIDGDNYYKTAYEEHNLVRTRAQYKLLTSMEKQYEEMCAFVKQESK